MKILVLLALLFSATSAKAINVSTFSFQSCNPDAPIQISGLTVTPDPLVFPGIATISLTGTNAVTIMPPTAVSVSLYKSVNGTEWEIVPCLGKLGSCDFSDVCALLDYKFPDGEGCPQPVVDSNLGCNCPIAIGTYTLTDLVINLRATAPANVTDGDYRLEITASSVSEELSCIEIYLSVEIF